MMNAALPSHPQTAGDIARMHSFLELAGWGDSTLEFLAGDCSHRTYYRVKKRERTAVLMVAPPEFENPKAFVDMAYILQELHLFSPDIYVHDFEHGYVLLEDFGDMTYTKALKAGMDEEMLYENAIDVLIHLHRISREWNDLPEYNQAAFMKEANLFIEWYYPAVMGHAPSQETIDDFTKVWSQAFQHIPPAPHSIVLRDYMVDNLMWLEDTKGPGACGLLDFQDALWGPVTYDLASLLEDARRDVSHDLSERMLERYLDSFPELNREAFFHNYFVWAAQRTTKVLGIFTRQYVQNGREQYLEHIPRLWRILEDDFRHPALKRVKAWFDIHVTERGIPQVKS